MESLGCGVPVILLTDDTGNHASEDIAADSSHYRKLNVKSESSDFIKLVKELGEFSLSKRKEKNKINPITRITPPAIFFRSKFIYCFVESNGFPST